jgi:hypothetical protein
MRQAIGIATLLFSCLVALAAAPRVAASDRLEPVRQLVATDAHASHPCTFYRSQAHRKGVTHFATEMHWACEAIVARRSAGMTLSDRLLATEHALIRYREALTEAASDRTAGTRTSLMSISDERKHQIAEESGLLVALEAISGGF